MDKQMRCSGPQKIGDADVALKDIKKWL